RPIPQIRGSHILMFLSHSPLTRPRFPSELPCLHAQHFQLVICLTFGHDSTHQNNRTFGAFMKILGAVVPIVFLYVFFANTSPISAQKVSPQKAASKAAENTAERQAGCASVDDEIRLESGKNTGDENKLATDNPAKNTGEAGAATKNEKITRPEVIGCITSGKDTRFPTKVAMDISIGRGDSVTVP